MNTFECLESSRCTVNFDIERCCIVTQGDTHELFQKNLDAAHLPVDVYLRDSHRAQDVRHYMQRVQEIESICFNQPSPRFALAHFGLNGPSMVVTAEVNGEVIGAQYVVWDGHVEGRRGLRFWTTVVHPDMRGRHVASIMTAVSTVSTSSWAEYGSTICDTDSSLMGRNVRLRPIIVTANMYHTAGRRKVQLEWDRPQDPFTVLCEKPVAPITNDVLCSVHTLNEFSPNELPEHIHVSADAQVWEDIANYPEWYRRRFRLVGWMPGTRAVILEDTHALATLSIKPIRKPIAVPLHITHPLSPAYA